MVHQTFAFVFILALAYTTQASEKVVTCEEQVKIEKLEKQDLQPSAANLEKISLSTMSLSDQVDFKEDVSLCKIGRIRKRFLDGRWQSLCSQGQSSKVSCVRDILRHFNYESPTDMTTLAIFSTGEILKEKLTRRDKDVSRYQLVDHLVLILETAQPRDFFIVDLLKAADDEHKEQAKKIAETYKLIYREARKKLLASVDEQLAKVSLRSPASKDPNQRWLQKMRPLLKKRIKKIKETRPSSW